MASEIRLRPGVPEFLFDDALVDHQQRLVRRWLPAKVYPWPVLEPDKPWEGRILCLYGTVLAEPGGGWRMYYSNMRPGRGGQLVMMATSPDGFVWEKPELGVVEECGTRANNIVVAPRMHLDSPSVIHDPQAQDWPWRMIAFQADDFSQAWGRSWGLYAWHSRNGVKWEEVPGVRARAGDRTNLMATRPGGRYVVYTRHPQMAVQTGGRAVYRTESEDFLDWTEPELVLAPDLRDEPDVEFYGMSVFERHGWFIGLLEYWRGLVDVIETHLVVSRDGREWLRPEPRQPFIAATYDWNRTWSTCASNGPIIVNEQMVFYFGGRWTSHHWDSAQQLGAIGFASIGVDRFCALEGTTGGHFVTQPVTWPGGDLVVNADTRQSFTSHPAYCDGELGVEVLDAQGRPLEDWSGDRRAIFRGNTHCRGAVHQGVVRWPQGRSLDALRGQTVRLRFHLRHARLFTFGAF